MSSEACSGHRRTSPSPFEVKNMPDTPLPKHRPSVEIGARAKAIRKRCDLTQTELGKLVGQTQRVISSWETGETTLSLPDAVDLCNVLNCTLDELAGRNVYDDPAKAELNDCYDACSPERREKLLDDARDARKLSS